MDESWGKIYNAHLNLLKMLESRKTPIDSKFASLEELFEAAHKDLERCLGLLSGVYRSGKSKILIEWTKNLNSDAVQKVYAECEHLKSKKPHAIIIWTEKKTAPSKNIIQKSEMAGGLNVETFGISQLQFHLPDHKNVFPHRKISKAEEDELLEVYHTSLDKLPGMNTDDVMTKFYNFQLGDVIEITRPNRTIGSKTLYWRVVRAEG